MHSDRVGTRELSLHVSFVFREEPVTTSSHGALIQHSSLKRRRQHRGALRTGLDGNMLPLVGGYLESLHDLKGVEGQVSAGSVRAPGAEGMSQIGNADDAVVPVSV